MNWQEKVFRNFRFYVVTDLKSESSDVLQKIERAYRGGADIIQLRSKVLKDAALIRLGLKIRKIATRQHKLYFMNDRVDLALATQADGVHLGQDDLPIWIARKLSRQAKQHLWIGKSTHSLAQALAAENEAADYIGVGPVFNTPTKPDTRSVGLRLVKQVSQKIRIPFVAIGGIDHTNLASVMEAGASRVAVVRAVFSASDPFTAARLLKNKLEGR